MNAKFCILSTWLIFLIKLNIECFVEKSDKSKIRNKLDDPDEYISTPLLIASKGYECEEHQVLTNDGYLIDIHRIPHGKNANSYRLNSQTKPVVLLQHGLLDASSTFVINFADQSLGFILADNGFDVWLGNMRGNTYGLNHVKLNKSQEEFWDFSFDEMAHYDLTAMVDYILKETGQNQLVYVGHSQGTMIGFAELGKNKDLASKIKLFVALAPVAQLNHIKSPLAYLAELGSLTNQQIFFDIFGKKDFLPSNEIEHHLADLFCNRETIIEEVCSSFMSILMGPSSNLNITRLPVYVTHTPAGTSVKNLVHFAQCVISGKFQMYDYNSEKANMLHYNQTTPPIYNIKNVKTPVALYSASNDWLADPIDVNFLRANLPNIVDDFTVGSWNHLDFIWATNAKQILYGKLVKIIKKFS